MIKLAIVGHILAHLVLENTPLLSSKNLVFYPDKPLSELA